VQLVVSQVAVTWLTDRAVATAAADEGAGDGRYGFQLTESAKALGIDFTHQGPTFDARLDHIMPQVASMGAAVAVVDFDKDGWLDLYVINSGEGSLNQLYRNKGDGTFNDWWPCPVKNASSATRSKSSRLRRVGAIM
jgi:hypothetical protein